MPPPAGLTWELFAEKQVLHGRDEVDLKTLQPGDRLTIVTKHTQYEFDWLEGGAVLLQTDRTDRPWGQVSLIGCVFRSSGIPTPGVVFKGGKLQYLTMAGQVKHQTTTIVSLAVARREDATRSAAPALKSAGR